MQIYKKKAITLTELLVASILIGIVMLGVMAVSYAIKSMQDTTNKGAILSMRTTATVNHIAKNVALAIGYQDDPGIVVARDAQWFAIRQESGGDPVSYEDDQWVIYYKDPDYLYRLYSCIQDDATKPPSPDDCSRDVKVISQDITGTEFEFVQEADPDLSPTGKPEFYLRVYLKTQYDPDGDFDLINNPSQEVTSYISPLGHSW